MATTVAGDRRIDVGGRLDRFDHRAGLTGGEAAADLGQLDEHQIAQRLLRMIADADLDDALGQLP